MVNSVSEIQVINIYQKK